MDLLFDLIKKYWTRKNLAPLKVTPWKFSRFSKSQEKYPVGFCKGYPVGNNVFVSFLHFSRCKKSQGFVAPPGATFLPNPRSTTDFAQPVPGVQENQEILNVRDDGWRVSEPTLDFSCGLWPGRVVYWRFLERNPADHHFMVHLEWPGMCYTTQFSRSGKIEQNRVFGQNSKIFFVLTALNIDNRFLLPLGFVGDVLCVFCATAPAVLCPKRSKARKIHSKKGYK